MRFQRLRGPIYGWRIWWGTIEVLSVIWWPYDDTPPFVPFVLDRWSCHITLIDRPLWQWNRWANRYGRGA